MVASLIIALVVAADQLSKWLVVRGLARHENVAVVPGFFDLTHIVNYGAAFGFLNTGPGSPWRTVFFVTVALAALMAMTVILRRTPKRSLTLTLAIGLVAGGAAGNLIDRVRLGYVVDFLDFYIGSHHWPAFNVADSAITVGVGLLLLDNFFSRNQQTTGRS